MTVVAELMILEALDVSRLSTSELTAAVARAGRLRGWLDAFDVRAAARAAELAATGSSAPPVEVLANGGRRRTRDAAAAAARAEVCQAIPGFEAALAAGECHQGMSTPWPAPRRRCR